MEILFGAATGVLVFLFSYCLLGGLYTVNQNERAVVTHFGKAERIGKATTLDLPVAAQLRPEEKERYMYPQIRVIGPGGPYLRLPWQRVFKTSVAIQTVNVAYDPDLPDANQQGSILEAVTKDQLNIGITGQIRYQVCEQNLYAYFFGVKRPIAHVIGYFVSILRERIANYESAPQQGIEERTLDQANESLAKVGVSINDLRKNLHDLNLQMDQQCYSSAARYGLVLNSSLITGFNPPEEIESALAAINTAHNEVSSNISLAQANADQRIEQSRRAVEIETNRAEAEVQPLRWMGQQMAELKRSGAQALPAYIRNVRLELFAKARRAILRSKN
ncbi:MAG: SPFH domain-containing protein [Verrucomicrobia bacterium]|nr:SPFH domain-containing protein [Verrucomicrobiota bacterium]